MSTVVRTAFLKSINLTTLMWNWKVEISTEVCSRTFSGYNRDKCLTFLFSNSALRIKDRNYSEFGVFSLFLFLIQFQGSNCTENRVSSFKIFHKIFIVCLFNLQKTYNEFNCFKLQLFIIPKLNKNILINL